MTSKEPLTGGGADGVTQASGPAGTPHDPGKAGPQPSTGWFPGERSGGAKLTKKQAREARAARGRETQWNTARRLGVSQSLVSLIQLGKAWAHMEDRS